MLHVAVYEVKKLFLRVNIITALRAYIKMNRKEVELEFAVYLNKDPSFDSSCTYGSHADLTLFHIPEDRNTR